ncbi:hypothetical protein [Polaribacter sp. Hel1_85]|uniref:hypothetical protein n=1 Tax=Polaribacter sp. Hel1_85 TaxID=1250005 RepID=UPI000569DAB4|nr:hypothetical protein [Polaribacter sp. Hel1_85]
MLIKKQINNPKGLSANAIFSIIELHLAETYKTTRVSDAKLNIRKKYTYISANSREVIHKQMIFKDSGYFIVSEDSILFIITLKKQLFFWLILSVLGVLITWKLWEASLLLSIFLITILILIFWIVKIIALKKFMSKEISEIEKKFDN